MRTVAAAGGVLWRPANGSDPPVEIAVIHRPKYDDWSLPKGKLDPGEGPVAAALREVLEETGYQARVGAELGDVTYLQRPRGAPARRKRVSYWAMEALSGVFVPHAEVDALQWLPPRTARARLSYDHDRGVLDAFVRRWPAVGSSPTLP